MTVDELTFPWNLRIKTIIVPSHGVLLYRWSVYKCYTLCVTYLMKVVDVGVFCSNVGLYGQVA